MTQQEFLNKYGIKATFEEMSKATGYLKFAGEALIPDTGKSAELMMYKQGLNFMFTKFIDSQTELDGFDNNQTLWELDLAQFANDFEDVMTNDPLKRDIGRSRKPYEGAELEIIDSLNSAAEKYNKEVKDVLASRIKSGADLGGFRKSTLIDLRRADPDEIQENVKNVSTMYLAMQKVIGERTWKDRINPLNWFRMINENVYMIQLNSRMKDITIQALRPEHTQAGPFSSYNNLETAMEEHAESNAYSNSVIDYSIIAAFKNYRNERAEQIPNELDMETTVIGRTSLIVDEAASDLDATIDTKDLYEDVPTKIHDRSIDSM